MTKPDMASHQRASYATSFHTASVVDYITSKILGLQTISSSPSNVTIQGRCATANNQQFTK